jgi:hypothetical protein
LIKKQHPLSLLTVAMALCAGLYAVGCYLTAYIPSPWGIGQFRPAVIIPALFATIFGPMPAGIGAAMGTLIADSVKHGGLYPGSLIAAVPGNFIGFYLFGYIVKKKFTWRRFITASNLTLTIANFIVAFLYVFAYKMLYAQKFLDLPLEALITLSIGLTIFWFVTMLPFVLLVTPLLIRAVAAAFPSIVPEDVRAHSLKQELPKMTFSLAMLIPGLIMLLAGLAVTYTVVGDYMSIYWGSDYFPPLIMGLLQLMFYGSGVALCILGILTFMGKMLLGQKIPPEEPR